MNTYALLIKEQNHTNLKELEISLKTEFKSYDYMIGFCDGYLFDNYRLLTLKEYENLLNTFSTSLKNKWIKFVTIIPEDEN